MTERKQKTFTFEIEPDTMAALDELRRGEPDLPSRGRMVLRLIKHAIASPRSKPREHFTQVREHNPLIRPKPHVSSDEKAVRAVRRGVASALEKRAGSNICPDCGANLNLVGARHNCRGTQGK